MIDYRFQGRLTYIPGGALSVNMSAWPAAGAAGWWVPTTGSYTVVAAYQAIGAASLAASYVNLANPGTNDAAPGTAPTFDTSYGWDFNGSTMYLTTGIVPTVSYTVLVRFSDGGTASNDLFGVQESTGPCYVRPSNGFSQRAYNNAGTRAVSGAVTTGVIGFAGKAAYLNGAGDGTIGAGTFTWTAAMYIGARNIVGTGPGGFTAARIQAVAIYSTTLDATQVAEITTNMQAL